MISMKKILVPTDFSEHSTKAVRYGEELALKFGATLDLIHTVETQPILYAEGGAFPFESIKELLDGAAAELEKVEIDSAGQLEVSRRVCDGSPFVEIVRHAKEHSVDLIVMGTHGRGAIAHMLLGSVAERVVRKAPCPVLIVRDEEHDFVMP
jgi:nucleotide-binding universal stress UspA family protein